MINTNFIEIPAYTTRGFVNGKIYKENEIYRYRFTPRDKALLNTGALKLFPTNMCEYKINKPCVLDAIQYKGGENLDPESIKPDALYVLMKAGVISCYLKDSLEQDVVKNARVNEFVGKTCKYFCEFYGLEPEKVKEVLKIKNITKKITKDQIQDLRDIITQEV